MTFIPFVNGELLYKQSFPIYNLQQSIYPILELRDFIAYAKTRQVQIQHEQQLHSRKSRVHILTSHAGNIQQICWALPVYHRSASLHIWRLHQTVLHQLKNWYITSLQLLGQNSLIGKERVWDLWSQLLGVARDSSHFDFPLRLV